MEQKYLSVRIASLKLRSNMKIKFCPKCKGNDLKMVAGGIIGMYECKNCGYRGAIFPEIDEKLESKPKEREIRFCPKCKSENVEIGIAPVGIPNIAALGPINKCLDCGFKSMIFPIKIKLDKKEENARRKSS